MNDLRLAVFEHIQRLSLNYFDKTHQGRIISRADTDIDSLDRILTWGANQLLASALTLFGVVALMVQYDWRLCLAVGPCTFEEGLCGTSAFVAWCLEKVCEVGDHRVQIQLRQQPRRRVKSGTTLASGPAALRA